MEMKLADNIRRFRKERSLTQEQLAEVLGVTTGAVYKWEAKLSQPDLDLIVQMADFFDVSVDVLLGYEIKDNRLEATVERLMEYRRKKDQAGLSEAEKALKKYPHSFKVVYQCATLYRAFGIESGDKALFRRAFELLEQALLLLPQNTDPEISEQTIYGKMAETYLGLDERNKAIELWKAHNADGLYDQSIGLSLAVGEHPEEAVPYLSEALVKVISDLVNTISGYLNVFMKRGDYSSAQMILHLGIGFFSALKKENKTNFLEKINSVLLAALAGSQFLSGKTDEARKTLIDAKRLALSFDRSPSYDESDLLFISRIEGASAHDDMGATAMEAVNKTVNEFESAEFAALWKSVYDMEDLNDD